MIKLFIVSFLMFSISCFAQDTTGTIKIKKVETDSIGPTFPGGHIALMDYISKKTKYPQIEKESGIQGTVWVSFTVEEDGSVADVKILRGVSEGPGCDKEALRVVKIMPKWIPAKTEGKPIKAKVNLAINFNMK